MKSLNDDFDNFRNSVKNFNAEYAEYKQTYFSEQL